MGSGMRQGLIEEQAAQYAARLRVTRSTKQPMHQPMDLVRANDGRAGSETVCWGNRSDAEAPAETFPIMADALAGVRDAARKRPMG